MADELTGHQQKLVSLLQKRELGEIIRPLMKEIHLFDTYVAGTSYLEDDSVLEKIRVGDTLSLRREDNEYDCNAILVLNSEGEKLGYVPMRQNLVFARLMDAGKLLKARISCITQKGSFTQIDIAIYMVDL